MRHKASAVGRDNPAHAKGRLDHALRASGWRAGLARKVAVRSLGENTLETVLRYIATQLGRADLADPRYVRSLAGAAWTDGDIDLSEPLASDHRRYWYNLHLVAVTDERWRVGRATGYAAWVQSHSSPRFPTATTRGV